MAKKQRFPHLLGSKWTSRQQMFGWRHFQVIGRRNEGRWVFAELEAACDETVRVWVNAKALYDRDLWQAGWRSLQEQGKPRSELGTGE
ncbi:MAG: TIGR02450 family Trp-rich protein [Prochlorothrix sp.]